MNDANLAPTWRQLVAKARGRAWFSCSGVATMSSNSSFRLNIFNIYHTSGLIRKATPGYGGRIQNYSSKRHIRQLRIIKFCRVWLMVIAMVGVMVKVSVMVRVVLVLGL